MCVQERETQFKDFENKYLSSRGDVAAKVAADTQQELLNMDKRVKSNTPQVRARAHLGSQLYDSCAGD